MNLIEICKPGKFRTKDGTEVAFSEADLRASAEAYDPAVHRAPLTIGHPKEDAPAFGLVKRVEFGGRMRVEAEKVELAFAEMVNAGRFHAVSPSFYAKDSPDNPKPGVYYLRHVAFLGAAPPSIKGLKPPEFSFKESDRGVLTFEFSEAQNASLWRKLRDFFIATFGLEKADQVVPAYAVQEIEQSAITPEPTPTSIGFSESSKEEGTMPPTTSGGSPGADATKAKELEFAEQKAALDQQKADQDQREKDLLAKETSRRSLEFGEFIDGLVKAGKVLPCHKAGLVDLMMAIPAARSFEFAEGDKKVQKPTIDLLKEVLTTGPTRVEFGEVAGAGAEPPDLSDPGQIAVRAQIYQDDQRKKGVELSFSECVSNVTKGGK